MNQPVLALFEQPTLFDGLEVHWPYVPGGKPRPIPSRALYRGHEPVNVLAYEGDGRFLVVRGDRVTSIHRNNLTFLKEKKRDHHPV